MHVPSYGENIELKHARIKINFNLVFKGLKYLDLAMVRRSCTTYYTVIKKNLVLKIFRCVNFKLHLK